MAGETDDDNTAIGYRSMYGNVLGSGGSYNTAYGSDTLRYIKNGNDIIKRKLIIIFFKRNILDIFIIKKCLHLNVYF